MAQFHGYALISSRTLVAILRFYHIYEYLGACPNQYFINALLLLFRQAPIDICHMIIVGTCLCACTLLRPLLNIPLFVYLNYSRCFDRVGRKKTPHRCLFDLDGVPYQRATRFETKVACHNNTPRSPV